MTTVTTARRRHSGLSSGQAKKEKKKKKDAPEQAAPEEQRTAVDPARGASLNDQGFALMQQGDFAAAVPLLEEAVASYPEDSQDIGYAYALFNLGKSLNRSGRPDEAIPVLERRLVFPDQRETVQRELDLARAKCRLARARAGGRAPVGIALRGAHPDRPGT